MRRIREIPLWMLPHSVTMRACNGVDLWQNPTWEPGTVYPHVKVQNSTRTEIANNNTHVQQVAVMYIPAAHATESPEAIKRRSEEAGHSASVLFDGQEYTVESVTAYRHPDGTPHHWKVGFV